MRCLDHPQHQNQPSTWLKQDRRFFVCLKLGRTRDGDDRRAAFKSTAPRCSEDLRSKFHFLQRHRGQGILGVDVTLPPRSKERKLYPNIYYRIRNNLKVTTRASYYIRAAPP